MKIALINSRDGADLGEDVVADCLKAALRDRLPGVDVAHFDLDGGVDWREAVGPAMRAARALVDASPSDLRRAIVRLAQESFARLYLIRRYREALEGASLAIFCGDLLSERDGSFPVKLAAASSVMRALRMKVALYAVGVGERWSPEAGAMFREAFVNANFIWASVGDAMSLARWKRHFGRQELAPPTVSVDPVMIAADAYGGIARPSALSGRRIGLSIAASSDRPRAEFEENASARVETAARAAFYTNMARLLIEAGFDILAFTDGAPADDAFMRRLFGPKRGHDLPENRIELAPRPTQSAALVEIIGGCEGVIASRLQTNMLAFALGAPHVGFAGDEALETFFRETGRAAFLAPAGAAAPLVVERLKEALDAGMDEEARCALIRRANQDLDKFAVRIAKSLGMEESAVIRRASSASVAEIRQNASARRGPIAR
ncbi:MAG: polysaccharide pyruvyl transferase family protein [Amphiplicatus sp.]